MSLRGFDLELEKRIREIARKEGISLNRAAIRLARKGAGLEESGKPDTVGNSLDHLIGKRSAEESKTFLKRIKPLEQIDRTFWR